NIENSIKKQFSKYNNLVVHKIQSGEQLLIELHNCSVGIAPYKVEGTNLGTSPNKMWQYLAAGLPVVVTALNSFNLSWPEHVFTARPDNSDFISLINEAIEKNSEVHLNERYKISLDNSWEKRMEEFLRIIEQK